MFVSILLLSLGFVALVSSCRPKGVVADLGDGRTVTMEVEAAGGFHSDWFRSLTLSDGTTELTVELYQDIGWWRGSALFREESGAYFLDDGIDFYRFTICPPLLLDWKEAPPTEGCPPGKLELSAPFSKFPTDRGTLKFLGQFVENKDGRGVVFQTWQQSDEPRREDLDAGG